MHIANYSILDGQLATIRLCKSVHPPALACLYHSIRITRFQQLVNLVRSLEGGSKAGQYVKHFALANDPDGPENREEDDEWLELASRFLRHTPNLENFHQTMCLTPAIFDYLFSSSSFPNLRFIGIRPSSWDTRLVTAVARYPNVRRLQLRYSDYDNPETQVLSPQRPFPVSQINYLALSGVLAPLTDVARHFQGYEVCTFIIEDERSQLSDLDQFLGALSPSIIQMIVIAFTMPDLRTSVDRPVNWRHLKNLQILVLADSDFLLATVYTQLHHSPLSVLHLGSSASSDDSACGPPAAKHVLALLHPGPLQVRTLRRLVLEFYRPYAPTVLITAADDLASLRECYKAASESSETHDPHQPHYKDTGLNWTYTTPNGWRLPRWTVDFTRDEAIEIVLAARAAGVDVQGLHRAICVDLFFHAQLDVLEGKAVDPFPDVTDGREKWNRWGDKVKADSQLFNRS